jgi:EAL domain-containing protein (putative c-di-GMP-specific phosphodiesterase class I)
VSAGDLCARLAGDQLAVVAAAGAVQAQMTAGRLLTVLAEPYPVLGVESHLSVAAGLVEHASDADASLSRAELALQRARRLGPAQPPQWYDEATAALLRRRLSIEQDLPGALGRGEFDLLFQPILELPRRRAVGIEASLRWRRPGLGTVPGVEFLGVVDQLGLHEQIGTWTLSAACRQLSDLQRDVWLVANVSTAHLAGPGFPETVIGVLNAHGVAPSQLVVQFTFSDEDAATARAITDNLITVRTHGVRTALDGFGAHATSLSRLRTLPLDIVKLDRRIFDATPGGPDHHDSVVAAVVNLAEQLGVEVAVSGVRTEPELRASVNAGCRLGQGDLFCPPAVTERLEAYLDSHRSATF